MIIEATGLTKEFARARGGKRLFTAVHPLDIGLEERQLTVVSGHSGSGKSTLANMLAGILTPTAGHVRLDGTDLYSLRDEELSRLRNERIGLVPQGHTALRALTVLDNVLLPSILYTKDEAPADRARELLVAVGLGDLTDAAPTELSGGELRRMAIARALLMDPAIVVADEPTAGLDSANATAVLTLLRDAADRGTAVLVVSHEAEAQRFADRSYVMEDGHLRASE
ncbi:MULTISPECIES: ABC transporter ATP-binding protein [Schaalia]|jgi:ABC-type antimicrobial peptide transport system, ATPase component|uniref:ATP-binding cassette domain-containing protein n=3 Tax=Schaalia TaxID=2529408 RepID=A0A857A621_9ACTO|nr:MULTISPECIES: ABC transporter ATP-binding protein [Schaalia]EDN81134.1 ABC transporter, ATP-binding protein [Schaalia odontolytica ATCC 17982]EFF79339.1 ABC transporter, ATP-binding protein [Schaalia odontolytica F0309]QGS10772.1 ATP-binding cassette domain-containing protein [Schaalia odontolytica]